MASQRIGGKQNASSVGKDHSLNHHGQANIAMPKVVLLTVQDGAIGKQTDEAATNRVEQRRFSANVQKRILLTGKRCTGQIFSRGTGTNGIGKVRSNLVPSRHTRRGHLFGKRYRQKRRANLGTDDRCGFDIIGSERIQFVIPPAVPRGTVSITVRKPSHLIKRLDDFEREGLFERTATVTRTPNAELLPFERELVELKDAGRYAEFLRLAVRKHQTIVVSGKTGSGKTTFMKGLVEEVPKHERLITIQDTAELTLPNHPNVVHLFYSKDAQGTAKVTAKSLLEACLRMKPDRIFLAEVRGDECFYFVRLAASGHPGSITSVHAGSCALAFEQMSLMIRETGAGGGLRMNEIKWLLSVVVDVIVQFDRDERGRFISEILYEPRRQRLGRWDQQAAAA